MKTRLFIVIMALAFGLSTRALAQDFSTGSSMMNSGSTLSSNVYSVGAGNINDMYTTSSRTARFATMEDDPFGGGAEGGEGDTGSPIGAPYILLLFAAAAAGVVALRRRKLKV